MEALRKVALAYYNSGTDEERRLFNQFFQSMDKDGNRRVSYREFSDFMSLQAHDENMRTRDFFNQLDIDGSGRLDFKEVLTLYYILKSRRPICGRCKIFITNEYFACMRCFETGSAAYSICLECFGDKGSLNHNHVRSYFVDNFSLLESLRKKPLPNHQRAIVPYNQNIPAEGRGLWQTALKVFEAALPIAGIVAGCSIM
ncbi:calcium-binding EF-hand family protein [Citrus sinensis]|uniref:Calcium-binding EF-hand family protein n=1 Tax=Citrus sinensis TaxID=2711 RepID=A0ACB8I976_CITSI|nr:calcium-binding EF-hand family protein [Citrus sinensis]